MKLHEVKAQFDQFFVLKDEHALEMVLATVLGNSLLERDPIWTLIIGPSSGGKTTLISPCSQVPGVFFVDDLTEKTLLSGYKVKGKEVSLLKMIGSGVLAFSDFTSILMKNPMSRGEILTQLKLVYDGKITKYTGTGGTVWEGKMGFIGASTPDIYTYLESGRSMGERFVYYWFEQPKDAEILAKQEGLKISSKQITEYMAPLYAEYCADVTRYAEQHGIPELKMSEELRTRVRQASTFCVAGKATIHTNFKTGKPDAIPNKAGIGRDNKMFDTILQALLLMKCYETQMTDAEVDSEMIDIIEKCAYSSINRERRKILEILVDRDGMMKSSDIGATEGLGLEKDMVELYLIPMHAVGLIRKRAGNPHRWFIDDQNIREFVLRVSPHVKETALAPAILPPEENEEEAPKGDLMDEYLAQ